MILILEKKATEEQLEKIAEELDGYIKLVVDIEREILAAGGEMHADCEKLLLERGSRQEDLWGGGLDLKTREVDFNSMINLRSKQDNPSRDVLSGEIRGKMEKITRELLL